MRATIVQKIIDHLSKLADGEKVTTAQLASAIGVRPYEIHQRAAFPELGKYRTKGGKGISVYWSNSTVVEPPAPVVVEEKKAQPPVDDRLELMQLTLERLQLENKNLRLTLVSRKEEARIVAGAIQQPLSIPQPFYTMSTEKDDIVLVVAYADWHLGEAVSPLEVPGCTYNHDVAVSGLTDINRRILQWTELHRKSYNVVGAQVFVMGDLISGSHHMELLRTNEASDPVCTAWAGQLLVEAVGTLAQDLPVNVTCVAGNHGRTGEKIQFKRTNMESYEYMAHVMLKEAMRCNDHVNVDITENPIPYVPIITRDGGKNEEVTHWVGALHGHQIKNSGTSPYYGLSRRASMLAKERASSKLPPFLTTMVAHFHSYAVLENGALMLVPSLVGQSEWSRQQGYATMPGQLAYFVGPHGFFDQCVFARK